MHEQSPTNLYLVLSDTPTVFKGRLPNLQVQYRFCPPLLWCAIRFYPYWPMLYGRSRHQTASKGPWVCIDFRLVFCCSSAMSWNYCRDCIEQKVENYHGWPRITLSYCKRSATTWNYLCIAWKVSKEVKGSYRLPISRQWLEEWILLLWARALELPWARKKASGPHTVHSHLFLKSVQYEPHRGPEQMCCFCPVACRTHQEQLYAMIRQRACHRSPRTSQRSTALQVRLREVVM